MTAQVAALAVEPDREQLGPRVPVAEPERVKVTVPVGTVGLALVSVTVAVQVDSWLTTTGVAQETVVVVKCATGGLTVIWKVFVLNR